MNKGNNMRTDLEANAEKLITEIMDYSGCTGKALMNAFLPLKGLGCDARIQEKYDNFATADERLNKELKNAVDYTKKISELKGLLDQAVGIKCSGS